MTRTVVDYLDQQVEIRPDAPAHSRKEGGKWVRTNWRDWREEIFRAGRGFLSLGVESGDVVTILADNRPEWTASLLAAMTTGGAGSGIYQTCAAEQVGYILNHCKSPVLVLDTREQWEKIVAVRDELTDLHCVVTMRGLEVEPLDGLEVMGWDELLRRGDAVPAAKLEKRRSSLGVEDLASVIYTSGTTGRPKGAMLSHENLLMVATQIRDQFGLRASDVGLSYLPLSHIAEQMTTVHMATVVGVRIDYAESIDQLKENLTEVRPTIFFAVPRVWERMYDGIQTKLAQAQGPKAKLARWAIDVGRRVAEVENRGAAPGAFLAAQGRLAEKLIGRKVRAAIGFDRIRLAASGAAPVAGDVLSFFSGLGLRIYEVYGLSESTGPATWNVPGRVKYGTVGPAFDGIEVRLAEDGEVEVRGPNVFLGYLHDPAATAEAVADGWLKTGDVGVLDADGFLSITGRKKEILITSGGKNIAPTGIEAGLKKIPWVQDAVALGDRRKFIAALFSLEPEAAAEFAAERGLETENLQEAPEMIEALQAAVDAVNADLARVESVREFRVLPRNLTIEDGELTPTLKLRRRQIEENWQDVIDDIYGGG